MSSTRRTATWPAGPRPQPVPTWRLTALRAGVVVFALALFGSLLAVVFG